jgi:hypothetical protein
MFCCSKGKAQNRFVPPAAVQVLKLLVVRHVHRVYVRDKGAQPCEVVGIITPTDILKVRPEGGSWGECG